ACSFAKEDAWIRWPRSERAHLAAHRFHGAASPARSVVSATLSGWSSGDRGTSRATTASTTTLELRREQPARGATVSGMSSCLLPKALTRGLANAATNGGPRLRRTPGRQSKFRDPRREMAQLEACALCW